MNILSPLTKNSNLILEKEILSDFIIDAYKKQLNINVTHFLKGVNKISLFRCTDSGYRFYYPLDVFGDGKFYEELEINPWYYMDWKWEHEVVSNKFIKSNDRILEIGCGRGAFLKGIQRLSNKIVGLEYNIVAADKGRKEGLNIFTETIEDHVQKEHGNYDLVCSFQVLEHVANPNEFILNSIKCLKSGGRLIICVPNNMPNSPILENSILNMPPHHMALWDAVSLANLQSLFEIKLEKLIIEPLQPYHYSAYQNLIKNKYIEKYGFLGKIINKITKSASLKALDYLSGYILGHSIMAVYIKK